MRVLLSVSAMTLIAVPLLAWADNDASEKKSDREKTPVAKSPIEITVEQEAAAVSLVQQHHKDLFELLIHLKEGLPEEYNRAIRDLSRANERLAQFEKRDPERYRIELGLWQAQSRRQLLTARLQMGYDASLLKDLRRCFKRSSNSSLLSFVTNVNGWLVDSQRLTNRSRHKRMGRTRRSNESLRR